MIVATLDHLDTNDLTGKRFREAFDWIASQDLQALTPGRHDIDGDDVRCAVTMFPPLTTVHQPCEDIALVAYRALRERMRDPSLPPRHILVPAPLVVRESTKR